MCGCNNPSIGGSVNKSSYSGKCSLNLTELSKLRNNLATLFNTEKDATKKTELKEVRLLIDDMISNTYTTGVCPTLTEIQEIKRIIDNEYAKRSNSN